jgi:hypothetical protein
MTQRHPFVLLLLGVLASPALAQEAPRHIEPHGPALFDEPDLLTAALDLAGRFLSDDGEGEPDEDGFYLKVGGMISGAGWIAAGPGYRRTLFGGHAFADAYAAVSWRGYLAADAVLEFPLLADGRLAAGVEGLWRDSTQVNYFGLGPESSEDLRSQYRLQTMNVVTYARYRPRRWLAVSSRFGWLDHPSVSSPTGPFRPDTLAAQAAFPDDPAMTLPEQPGFLHGEVAITTDTRDFPGHLTQGSLYHASAGAYVADEQRYSFQRYEVEGLHALSLFDRALVVVLHGWGLFTHASPRQEVPFYLMPSLGGSYTLRGYSNYRFHDRHLLLTSVESRFPIFVHLDGAVFVDAGTVAARVSDLGLDKKVYGFGLRLHSHRSTLARLDVAHTDEGWHMMFRSSDPFDLDRLTRWVAAVPFVP